jgi:hypothetical protein
MGEMGRLGRTCLTIFLNVRTPVQSELGCNPEKRGKGEQDIEHGF